MPTVARFRRKSFLQHRHLRRPSGFIARHLHRRAYPGQTALSRSEERFRREVHPPTRTRYFYLESGRKSTDPMVTFIPPEEDSFPPAAHTANEPATSPSLRSASQIWAALQAKSADAASLGVLIGVHSTHFVRASTSPFPTRRPTVPPLSELPTVFLQVGLLELQRKWAISFLAFSPISIRWINMASSGRRGISSYPNPTPLQRADEVPKAGAYRTAHESISLRASSAGMPSPRLACSQATLISARNWIRRAISSSGVSSGSLETKIDHKFSVTHRQESRPCRLGQQTKNGHRARSWRPRLIRPRQAHSPGKCGRSRPRSRPDPQRAPTPHGEGGSPPRSPHPPRITFHLRNRIPSGKPP